MDTTQIKITEIACGTMVPGNGGAVVLDTLASDDAGRVFWYDTNNNRHYETGGTLTVYVSTVRTQAVGEDRDKVRHALVNFVPDETPRAVCETRRRKLDVWESGTALAGVTCTGCRGTLGLIGTYAVRLSNGI